MSHFDRAIDWVLVHEGGFVDHSSDPGGATNWGISLRWWQTISPGVAKTDVKNLSKETAKGLYKKYFWSKYFDHIEDFAVATKVFDMCVNMGQKRAISLLQRAVNSYGANLEVDGVIGPETVRECACIHPKILIRSIQMEQAQFYYTLVVRRQSRKVFLMGWLKRAYSVPA